TGTGQPAGPEADPGLGDMGTRAMLPQARRFAADESIEHHATDVVTVAGIPGPRVAQAHDEPCRHAAPANAKPSSASPGPGEDLIRSRRRLPRRRLPRPPRPGPPPRRRPRAPGLPR